MDDLHQKKKQKTSAHLSVDGVHVYVSFLGPLLPELRIIQGNVVAVLRGHEAGFGERRAFTLALDGDGGGSSLEDLVDVLFTEAAAFIVLIHDGSVGSLSQQVLNLLFGELLDLLKVTRKPIYTSELVSTKM